MIFVQTECYCILTGISALFYRYSTQWIQPQLCSPFTFTVHIYFMESIFEKYSIWNQLQPFNFLKILKTRYSMYSHIFYYFSVFPGEFQNVLLTRGYVQHLGIRGTSAFILCDLCVESFWIFYMGCQLSVGTRMSLCYRDCWIHATGGSVAQRGKEICYRCSSLDLEKLEFTSRPLYFKRPWS